MITTITTLRTHIGAVLIALAFVGSLFITTATPARAAETDVFPRAMAATYVALHTVQEKLSESAPLLQSSVSAQIAALLAQIEQLTAQLLNLQAQQNPPANTNPPTTSTTNSSLQNSNASGATTPVKIVITPNNSTLQTYPTSMVLAREGGTVVTWDVTPKTGTTCTASGNGWFGVARGGSVPLTGSYVTASNADTGISGNPRGITCIHVDGHRQEVNINVSAPAPSSDYSTVGSNNPTVSYGLADGLMRGNAYVDRDSDMSKPAVYRLYLFPGTVSTSKLKDYLEFRNDGSSIKAITEPFQGPLVKVGETYTLLLRGISMPKGTTLHYLNPRTGYTDTIPLTYINEREIWLGDYTSTFKSNSFSFQLKPESGGSYEFYLKDPSGKVSKTYVLTIANAPTPIIASISPSNAVAGQETTFTITGSNFLPGAIVRHTNVLTGATDTITPTNITSTSLSFEATPRSSGNLNIVVENLGGIRSAGYNLTIQASAAEHGTTPTITTIEPTEVTANITGVNPIVGQARDFAINGSNFQTGATIYYAYANGSSAALVPKSVSNTKIVFSALFPQTGTVALYVTNPGGNMSNVVMKNVDAVPRNQLPEITNISLVKGGNTNYYRTTIAGHNFSEGMRVRYMYPTPGGTGTSYNYPSIISVTPTQIVVSTSIITSGPLQFRVECSTGGGCQGQSNTVTIPFAYGSQQAGTPSTPTTPVGTTPTITSMSPSPASGGSRQNFVITGENFKAGMKLRYVYPKPCQGCGNYQFEVTPVSITSTQVVATIDLVSSGNVQFTLIGTLTNGGNSNTVTVPFTYTGGSTPQTPLPTTPTTPATTAPTISSITPATAVVGQETTFVITGTNFQSGAKVQYTNTTTGGFGPLTPASVTATRVTLVVTPGAAGTIEYRVQNPDGELSNTGAPITLTAPTEASQAVTLTNITPNRTSVSSTPVTFTFTGTNFKPGATIKYVNKTTGGSGDLTPSSVASNGRSLTLNVILQNRGVIELWIQNTDNTTSGKSSITIE